MKRTRKWSFVAQEATRLAGLSLSPLEISKRLGVNKSTITRWMAAGKIRTTGKAGKSKRSASSAPRVIKALKTPEAWATSVRKNYDLDATDDQLVKLAEIALRSSLDPALTVPVRMTAARTFQGLVRQLALTSTSSTESQNDNVASPESQAPPPREVRQPGADPRVRLMSVVK